MTPATARGLVRRVGPDPDPPADAELVRRFARTADPAAFAALVRRHGPMVLAACRRMLPTPADADDAFQAGFVVLLRKAGAVRPAGAVGGWLHGVAVRTAQKARVAAARRRRREMNTVLASPGRQPGVSSDAEHAELRAVLDEELAKLPEPLRAAVVLCDLAGKTRAEAAADLGCPEGTVAARVHRARKALAERLTRRGLAAPAALASAAVPAELFAAVAGFADGGPIPSAVRTLADGVVRSMVAQPLSLAVAALAAVAVAAGALWAAGPQPADGPAPAPAATVAPSHVTALSFAPDGKTYLVVAGGQAQVKDAATDRLMWVAPAEAARFTADGTAVMTLDKDVTRRDAATGKARASHPRGKSEFAWHAAGFAADGARYAAHDGLRVRLFDTATGFEPVRLTPEVGEPLAGVRRFGGKDVLFSPDGKWLAAVGMLTLETDFGAAAWDAGTGKRVLVYPPPFNSGERQPANAAAFSPDSKTLAVAIEDSVDLFDAPGFKFRDRLPDTPGSGPVTALAFAPDGTSIAVAYRLPLLNGADKEPRAVGHKTEVQVIDLATKTERRRFDGFEGVSHMGPTVLPVTALAFSPDGTTLLAGTGVSAVEKAPAGPLPPGEVKRFALADPPAKAAAPAWREQGKIAFEDRVHSVAFGPDGKQLAVGGRGGAAQHTVTMWDAATWRKLWAGGPVPAGTTGVSFSPDGKLLAATRDKTTGLYDARTGQPVLIDPPLPGGKAVAFSHGAERMAGQMRYKLAITDGQDVMVTTWGAGVERTNTGFGPGNERVRQVDDPRPAAVAFSPSGERLVFIPNAVIDYGFGAHWAAYTWTGTAGPGSAPALPHGKHGTTAPISAVAWSPDGKHVATGCRKGDVAIWDAATFKELRRTRLGGRGGEGNVRALAFAPDGCTLAVAVCYEEGRATERVVMLDPATAERRGADLFDFGLFTPVSLAFAPNGRTLAVGLADFRPQLQLPPGGEDRPLGSVVLFTTDPEPKAAPAPPPDAEVTFAPDGKTYLFVHGGKAQLADAATDRVRWDAPADAARFSPDGKTVLTLDDSVAHRDAATGKVLKEDTPPRNRPVRAAAFSPDGKRYATHHGNYAQVSDGFEFAEIDPWPPKQPPAARARLAWSPDGKRLAVAGLPSADGRGRGVTVWDATTRRSAELAGLPAGEVRAVAFSPDGKTLAVGMSSDVYLWADGAKEPRREALLGELGAVGFLADGRLVTAGEGRYADGSDPPVYERRLFAHVVDPKADFGGHAALDTRTVRPAGAPPVTSLAVSPDGKTVLVAAAGGVTRLSFADRAAPEPPVTWTEKATLPPLPEPVHALAFRPGGKELATGGRTTAIRWSLPDLVEENRIKYDPLRGPSAPLAYSPDGKVFGLGILGGFVPLDGTTWGGLQAADAPNETRGFLLKGSRPLAAAFGLPGPGVAGRPRYKAATTDGATATMYTWVAGGPVATATFDRPKDAPKLDDPGAAVAFSPSGEQLVFLPNTKDAAGRWVAQVWGGGGKAASHVLPHGPAPLTAAAWSPDGTHLATGCRKGDVVIWDATTFKELRRVALTGRSSAGVVHALAFSPDGKTLAAAVDLVDGKNVDRVVLLDPATGERGRDIQGFSNAAPRALAFAPDGKTLAVGCVAYRVENARRTGDHGLVKLYAAAPGG